MNDIFLYLNRPWTGTRWLRCACLWASLTGITFLASAADRLGPILFRDDFDRDLHQWSLEQVPGGRVFLQDNGLVIEDSGGTTLWFRAMLSAPVEINYEAEVVVRNGPHDRLSDLNCFWMAQDRIQPTSGLPAGRSGRFPEYDNLFTYYVGYGGNNNTTTRFRRYDGTSDRPLRPEDDLRDATHLLAPNHVNRIRIIVRDGLTEYWQDGTRVFAFKDPTPLTTGYFGFRTVHSHLVIRHFKISRPPSVP